MENRTRSFPDMSLEEQDDYWNDLEYESKVNERLKDRRPPQKGI